MMVQKEKQLKRCYDETYGCYQDYVVGRNEQALRGAEDWIMEEVFIMTEKYTLDDKGDRVEFETGAIREPKSGKGRYDLISPIAMRRLAGVLERGAKKYDDRNWEKGIKLSSFLDSAKRHLNQYEEICLAYRNNLDISYLEDQGIDVNEDHLGQLFWNIHCLIHTEAVMPEMDDLTVSVENEKEEDTKPTVMTVEDINKIFDDAEVVKQEPLLERALRSWKSDKT